MAATPIINPEVRVNNVTVSIMPNSFSYSDGFGEYRMRVQTAGPKDTDYIPVEDVETQRGRMKFSVITTTENASLVRQWKANLDNNVVTASFPGFQRTANRAILITDPEVMAGVDGVIELEFESHRLV